MASSSPRVLHLLILHLLLNSQLGSVCNSLEEFWVDDDADMLSTHGDYSPPSPPPPPPLPHPPAVSCVDDLKGFGSLDTICELSESLNLTEDVYIAGNGSFFIHPFVKLNCPFEDCNIIVNITGEFRLGSNAEVVAGTLYVVAGDLSLGNGSVVNVTALAGPPPEQTSGTPVGTTGGGGGHGGRGASCVMDNTKLPEDVWGGDAYSWASLEEPWSYGSKGGTTSKDEDYGGKGGGRIRLEIVNFSEFNGSLIADGGEGGVRGGGGSGGSIYIEAHKSIGTGNVSASGGNGFAGGGGGRVSVNVFSRHDELEFFVHGGSSYGCHGNSGGAGTFYDAIPRRLIVNNNNMSTVTDTLLLEFPFRPLWTNVYIQNHGRAVVPLLWSRVQVQGQLSLTCGAVLSFGLAHVAMSEFELIAEELLMSDSTIKVYGALRMVVKIQLMWNSKILIDGDGDAMVATSLLEASNLVVLRESSVIHSNANLGVHGQGFLNLTGPGDLIEAQRLVLSLFYSISVGPGSVLRGPLENASNYSMVPKLYCNDQGCPKELLRPPEDCNLNSSLPFTLEICRVEDVSVEGFIEGSVVHFHWVRAVDIQSSGTISATGLGCVGGMGRGRFLSNGLGGGGGHGGKGGNGYYNGHFVEGGDVYGNADLPCELGSGSGNESLAGAISGGGIVVMGSLEHSLSILSIDGSLKADGGSFGANVQKDHTFISDVGPGGGSGGTVLLFVQRLSLGETASISTAGGRGGPFGGGGGGGRIHFHWSDIPVGDDYFPIASVGGTLHVRGGIGGGHGDAGQNGTITGKACPKGLFGIYCQECPIGTYKNVSGSGRELCRDCPPHHLPHRAIYIPVRGGIADLPCPYKCISERYHLPHCYTTLEELIYTFGGPWLFGFILLVLLVLLALVLSVARMKFVNVDELPGLVPTRRGMQLDRSFPFLESLNEVLETSRTEESQTHVHRMYFMGPNTFREPWHLTHSPPEQVKEIVYEDAFNIFVDEINALAAYQWWEGSVHTIVLFFAYPLAWSWLQWRRKKKVQRLREFVRSEYDHACLRSCRSRALYEGLKVAATSDLMLAYVDFFLGGDEKRVDLPPRLHERFPISLLFGGDGSYMAPFCLHSDNILTSLISQCVPPTIWYRLVSGLNAQLRLVHRGHLKTSFGPIMNWLETHSNPTLSAYGVRADLACFQPTACGYQQFGLTIYAVQDENLQHSGERSDAPLLADRKSRVVAQWRKSLDLVRPKKPVGGIIQIKGLQTLGEKKRSCFPLLFVLRNTRPVGHQDLVGLVISVLLLGDFSVVLLTLLQLYSISLLDLFLFLFVLPLGILLPFPAGISALFSHGPRRSAGHARVYALWNSMSIINVVVALICGLVHYKSIATKRNLNFLSWNFSMDESGWWLLPSGLLLCKVVQTRLVNYHIANLEIQDRTLYSSDPDLFWQS